MDEPIKMEPITMEPLVATRNPYQKSFADWGIAQAGLDHASASAMRRLMERYPNLARVDIVRKSLQVLDQVVRHQDAREAAKEAERSAETEGKS